MRAVLISDVENKKAHAGYKARFDVMKIAIKKGMPILYVTSDHRGKTIKGIVERLKCCIGLFRHLKIDDLVFINYPNNNIYVKFLFLLKSVRKIRLIAIIHDLDSLRSLKNKDEDFLPAFDGLISHNDKMSVHLAALTNKPIHNLGVFDYIIESQQENVFSINEYSSRQLIYVGNLNYLKSSFIYDYRGKLEVWGNGFDKTHAQNKDINHKGVFDPNFPCDAFNGYKDKLVFGLVWDGNSAKNCEGVYGQYLKINNPHKTSFYLSQDLPVVIWKEAALASFVLEHDCGILIESLDDAKVKIENISTEEYSILKYNAQKVGEKIRNGDFLNSAMDNFIRNE